MAPLTMFRHCYDEFITFLVYSQVCPTAKFKLSIIFVLDPSSNIAYVIQSIVKLIFLTRIGIYLVLPGVILFLEVSHELVWLRWSKTMEGNRYTEPHIGKNRMIRSGNLPSQLLMWAWTRAWSQLAFRHQLQPQLLYLHHNFWFTVFVVSYYCNIYCLRCKIEPWIYLAG